jgi:hypothetical protein
MKPESPVTVDVRAIDVLPTYELDDGPLTEKQVAALRKDVEKHFPRGKLISRESLFK